MISKLSSVGGCWYLLKWSYWELTVAHFSHSVDSSNRNQMMMKRRRMGIRLLMNQPLSNTFQNAERKGDALVEGCLGIPQAAGAFYADEISVFFRTPKHVEANVVTVLFLTQMATTINCQWNLLIFLILTRFLNKFQIFPKVTFKR